MWCLLQVLSTARHQANRWADVMSQADRSVTLVDLCGHERYLKTTISGLTGGNAASIAISSLMTVDNDGFVSLLSRFQACYQTSPCY